MDIQPKMRISGLGSGFDVGGTIAQLMELEARRIERMQEVLETNNEKIGGWIDVKNNLTELTRAADTLRWMDVWRSMACTSTNPGAVTATARAIAASESYSVNVLQMAHAHTIASAGGLTTDGTPEGTPVTATTKLINIDGIEEGHQFEIGGSAFTIAADTTLQSLRNEIDQASADMPEEQRVTASILDNRLVLQRFITGEDEIALGDTEGSPLQILGIVDELGEPAHELLAAQNALFSVNGAVVERSANTGLSDVLEGVTFNLYGLGFSTVTISRDNEGIKEAIQAFVNTYNTAADVIEFYGKFDRTDPALPRPGLLQGDSKIRDMSYRLRSTVGQLMSDTHTSENAAYEFNGIEGVMNSLQAVGIWTTGEENRLSIVDEERLDAMLERYPDEVENLFRGVPSTTQAGAREGGIALDLYQLTRRYTSTVDGSIDIRIESIDGEIQRQNERIDRMLRELDMTEKRLWREFGAMDEAIGRMQSGFEFLLGQLNPGRG